MEIVKTDENHRVKLIFIKRNDIEKGLIHIGIGNKMGISFRKKGEKRYKNCYNKRFFFVQPNKCFNYTLSIKI